MKASTPILRRPLVLTLAVVLVAGALALVAGQAHADHDGTHTMVGEYYWTGGKTGGDIKAVFTPTGDGTWDVEFFFDFRKKPHVYAGTAEGSLTDGTLEGKVKNENRRRTFIFGGTVVESKLSATHAEITADERQTGTLEMSLQ